MDRRRPKAADPGPDSPRPSRKGDSKTPRAPSLAVLALFLVSLAVLALAVVLLLTSP